MARKLKSDRMLFLATILLVGLSILFVYSASAIVAQERYQQPYLFLTKQAMWALLGLAVLGIVMRVDYRVYREPVFIWSCLGIVTLGLLAVLFSAPVNNARRWFALGGLGIQPSELAKLSVIFFVAALLQRRLHRINEVAYSLTPITVVVAGLVTLVLLEPDFGTALAIAMIAAAMVFAAGLSFKYIGGAALALVPLVVVIALAEPYRRTRLLAFANPWDDPLNTDFQVIQSLLAVGTGGVTGRGLMGGVQKLFYLPYPDTDFIYAVISEELGLVGATLVLGCFCVIVWRGLRAALEAPDSFGALTAIGLTMMMAVQAFANISVVLGLMPTKGIPLPFVSYGGSSLLINLVGMGVLLNISQHGSSET
jgi:cell division protein FtsW